MSAAEMPYQVWWWDNDGGEHHLGSFRCRCEAKAEFDNQILKDCCKTAGVYDVRTRGNGVPDRALWTFPSHWDGHLS